MKMHVPGRNAVHGAFCFREACEDAHCMGADRRPKRRAFERRPDVAPRNVMVMMVVAIAVVVVVMEPVRLAVPSRNQKAMAGQHPVIVGHKFHCHACQKRQLAQRPAERLGEIGPEIEQACGEHVAGNAPEGVEVEMHGQPYSVSDTPFNPATMSDSAGTKSSPWPVATAVAKPLRTTAPTGLATPALCANEAR